MRAYKGDKGVVGVELLRGERSDYVINSNNKK